MKTVVQTKENGGWDLGRSAESGEVGSRFGFSRVEKSGFADGLNVRENKIKNHS